MGGSVPHPSRAALIASFDPPDPAAAAELADRLTGYQVPAGREWAISVIAGVARQARSFSDRALPLEDCLRALSSPWARLRALRETAAHPWPMSRLWADMVRAVSGPERARPATLLATAAYLAGDQVVASIAIEIALRSTPGDHTADAIYMAIHMGLPPEALKELLGVMTE